jgi:hypothetical protein
MSTKGLKTVFRNFRDSWIDNLRHSPYCSGPTQVIEQTRAGPGDFPAPFIIFWRFPMSRNDHLNHAPDAEGIEKIESLRRYIIGLEDAMDTLVPTSRELSIAKTKLEEVRMWAVKGIAMQYPAQEV